MRYRFEVQGMLSNELLLRTLNLFAQQGLVPDMLSAGREVDGYRIDIEVTGDHPARIELLAEKLRALVLVTEASHAPVLPARAAA
jgi:acetolactate synthase regulatory subunit